MPRSPTRRVCKSKNASRKKKWCLCISKSLLSVDEKVRSYYSTESKAKAALKLSKFIARKSGIRSVAMDDRDRKKALKAMETLGRLGMTIDDAVKEVKAYRAEEAASVPFGELVELYRANLRGKAKQRTDKYLGDLERMGKVWANELGALPVCKLTYRRVEQVFAKLNLTPYSKNAHIRMLRAVLRHGVKPGYLDGSIVQTLDLDEIPHEPKILTVAQAGALMLASPPSLVPYWAVCLFAGLRPQSEAFGVTWADVNFETKKIRVDGKTGIRFVPMEENLITWLKPYSGLEGLICPPVNWRKLADKTRADADKLLIKAKRKDEAILVNGWPHDATRNSAASYLLQLHGGVEAVSERLGHLPSTLRDKYRVDIEADGEARRYFNIRPRKVKNVVPIKRAG